MRCCLNAMDKVINFGPAAIFVLAGVFFAMIRMTNAKGKANEPKVKALMDRNLGEAAEEV